MRWIGLGFGVCLLAAHGRAGTIRGTVSSIPAIEWGAVDGHFWRFDGLIGVAEPVLLILESVDPKAVKAKLPPPILTIEGFGLHPPILPIRAGATLTLRNLDRHPYSCFGEGQAEEFALNDVKGGGEMEKKVPSASRLVMRCHAFPFMRAEVVVVNHSITTYADRNGDFAFSDVPPGEYTLRVYASGAFRETKTVKVEASGAAEVHVAVQIGGQEQVPVSVERPGKTSAAEPSATTAEPPAKGPVPAAELPAKAPKPAAEPPAKAPAPAAEPPAKAPAPAAEPPAKVPPPPTNPPAPAAHQPSAKPPTGPPAGKPPLVEKKRPKKPKKDTNDQEIEIEIE